LIQIKLHPTYIGVLGCSRPKRTGTSRWCFDMTAIRRPPQFTDLRFAHPTKPVAILQIGEEPFSGTARTWVPVEGRWITYAWRRASVPAAPRPR